MATYGMRWLVCLALFATVLSVAQALTLEECKAKEATSEPRCNKASHSFCERWICQQNVNRKYRICVETAGTAGDVTGLNALKAACDDQQRNAPTKANCTVNGTTYKVGIWYNKDLCDKNNPNNDILAPTVKAESDTLDIIKKNRTDTSWALYNNTDCVEGVPPTGFPQCLCLKPLNATECVDEIKEGVVKTNPDLYPTPDYTATLANILISEYNFTEEEANAIAKESTCTRFPELDECKGTSPDPVVPPVRRLLEHYLTEPLTEGVH